MPEISIRLLIDKEQKRVVYAEAGSDFIDVLFSFLTLPLGSIVQLLGKKTGLGSLDSLYESVEELEVKLLQTKACQDMLLKPRSAAAKICEDLKIKKIHDANPRTSYFCDADDCLTQSTCYYSYVKDDQCTCCGGLMSKNWVWPKGTIDEKGVFVNNEENFIITDDLRVIQISLMSAFSILEELRIKDSCNLEEMVVKVGTKETLSLLRRSLVSKHAFTDIFIPCTCVEQSVNCFPTIKKEIYDNEAEQKINVKIMLNKKNNCILYAEVGGDFLNQLLSFLTFPLASVFRLLSDHTSQEGCISNLYSSAKELELKFFLSEERKNMLVCPELASYYGCENQMLKLVEMKSTDKWKGCMKCFKAKGYTSPWCKHGLRDAELTEQNPKLQDGGSDYGGGFVEYSKKFMIVDNLKISPISSISAITSKDFIFSDIVEKEISVDKAKILSLLMVMLMSKNVLTDVFSPKSTKWKRCHYI